MEDSSPPSFGLDVLHNLKVTLVNDTAPRAKRPLGFLEEDQPLQSPAKKLCHLSHYCSTPCPSKKLPRCSSDSPCFLDSSACLDDTQLENIVIRVSLPEDSAVALSVDRTRCFDDSEPDDTLLEPSDDEQGNSPFNYTEEECKELLADDSLEDQHSTGESALVTQDVWSPSEKEMSSNYTQESVPSEDTKASFRTIDEFVSNEFLSQTGSFVNPEYHPILETQTAPSVGEGGLAGDCLKAGEAIGTRLDCDLQGLLNLSPTDADSVDQLEGDDGLEETGGKASRVIRHDPLQRASKLSAGYDEISSNSLDVEEDPECLASKEPHSAGMESVEKLLSEIKEPSPFDAHFKIASYSPAPACGHSKDEMENPVPLLQLPLKTSDVLNWDPSRGAGNGSSGTFGSPKDLNQESTSVEESSDTVKKNAVVLDQNRGEEPACGKKLGKVIPVPQVEERPKRRLCISEVELEQKKHIYIQCVRAHIQNSMDPAPGSFHKVDPNPAHRRRCVSQPCLTPADSEPFGKEQGPAVSAQQGGASSEESRHSARHAENAH